jgi:hypothetical protein
MGIGRTTLLRKIQQHGSPAESFAVQLSVSVHPAGAAARHGHARPKSAAATAGTPRAVVGA